VRARKGRGAGFDPVNRYDGRAVEPFDDGWGSLAERAADPPPATEILPERAKRVITRNRSPDVPFDRSLNPYRGCEHGCIYCYARPGHERYGLSAGLDFETRIFAKHDAAERLAAELSRPGYRPAPLALGADTDPYQPAERRLGITRRVLEVLRDFRHPVTVTTKSAGVLRDVDILADMAREGLVRVNVSVTTLDPTLARRMEPRAAAPHRRLAAIRGLAEAGIPVLVMVAPVIPALNDHEMEAILEAAATAGARGAGWILLRLPGAVADLFVDWLERHVPARRARVLARLAALRGGRLSDAAFGRRMHGVGVEAELLARRFALACRRLGLDRPLPPLRTDRFRQPGPQGELFA